MFCLEYCGRKGSFNKEFIMRFRYSSGQEIRGHFCHDKHYTPSYSSNPPRLKDNYGRGRLKLPYPSKSILSASVFYSYNAYCYRNYPNPRPQSPLRVKSCDQPHSSLGLGPMLSQSPTWEVLCLCTPVFSEFTHT